jgi:sugar lactone lactonase YvrE
VAAAQASYTVTATNSAGSTTFVLTLTVNAAPVVPSITTQPQPQTVTIGATATFTVTASGTATLSYQWSKNSVAIAGATSASYTTPATTLSDSGVQFSVRVSNSVGNIKSAAALLTVNPVPTAPSFSTQPRSATAAVGATATFSVSVTGGTAPLKYNWWRNNTIITGAGTASFTTPAVSAQNNGDTYYATVFDGAGFLVLSTQAYLTVTQTGLHGLFLIAGEPGENGSVDGTGGAAQFSGVDSIATDQGGNLYVTDGCAIRKITIAGVASTFAGNASDCAFADGTSGAARLAGPSGIAIDSTGNLFVVEQRSHTIRKITPAAVVTTFAGNPGNPGASDGIRNAAQFNVPSGIAIDSAGSLYVADQGNYAIRKVTPAGAVTTLAGSPGNFGSADGAGSAARFRSPTGIATDPNGNLYVADFLNHTIRKVTPTGVVSTLAGAAGISGAIDGTGSAARFTNPFAVVADSAGNVYVADTRNDEIRKITATGIVTTVAGLAAHAGYANGTGNAAYFNNPYGIALDSAGNLFIADLYNYAVRKVAPGAIVTTLAGIPPQSGSADGTGNAARFFLPTGIAIVANGDLYVADSNNYTIRHVTSATAAVTTVAGTVGVSGTMNGTGTAAQFAQPFGLASDTSGNIYVADVTADTIRRVTPAGVVTTFCGIPSVSGANDAQCVGATFKNPEGVATDTVGNLYVADTGNNSIRLIAPVQPGYFASTYAGGSPGSANGVGTAAQFRSPTGIAVDSARNIYVADTGNNTIRKIAPVGIVTTLAGTAGVTGSGDGTGSTAQFNGPAGVAVDARGNVYVADTGNHTIRKITAAGVVTTAAGRPGTSDAVAQGDLPGALWLPTGIVILTDNGSSVDLAVTDAAANAVLFIGDIQ